MMDTGTFVLSLDTELIWGVLHRNDYEYYYPQVLNVERNLPLLLDIMDRYDIKATFGVVGHLMLKQCSDDCCPCKGMDSKLVFGQKLIEQISERGHEIGLHSYTHKYYDQISAEDAEEELKKAIISANKMNINVSSFIFPQNRINHLNILKKYNISAYRGEDLWWFKSFPFPLNRIAQLVDYILVVSPPVYSRNEMHVPVNVPGSMFYLARDGYRKYIPMYMRTKKAKKGIDKAVKENKIFHLWFHIFNLSTDRDVLLKGLEEIFEYVAKMRNDKKITVKTMRGIAI